MKTAVVEADSTSRLSGSDHTGVLIREATADDLDALVQLGEDFNRSTPYAGELTSNPAQHRAIGAYLIDSPTAVLLMAEVAGVAAGMIGVFMFDHPLSGERAMGEMFFFVDLAHRGSIGVRLLKAAETWGRAQGAVLLQMTQPVWADRVGGLYQALGYHRLEVAWTKRLGASL